MALKNLSKRDEKCSLRIYEIIYFFEFFFVICTISAQECFDDGNEFCINQEDILSADLLPGSFLFNDQYKNSVSKTVANKTVDGSFVSALHKMDYHRKRMNEYLCHGYMAEEIFKEVSTPRVKRHPESLSTNNLDHNFLGNDNITIQDKLLADEGSSGYKDWLHRTTTLNDVYRHYAPHKKIRRKQDVQHDDIEEFDGEVTGYAMQAPLPSNGKVGVYEPSHEDDMLSSSTRHHSIHYGPSFDHHHGDHYAHHSDFFPSIHEEYYYPPHQHDHHDHHDHHEEEHKPSYSKGKGHELSIRDFFEIALTALAFLAFGLFIIQLCLNATDNNGSRRFKRNTISLSSSTISNEDLNELSYRVLRSIEAAMIAEADSGNCLRRILCEDNQYSKETKDDRRIWIPVWSLGMSWLSGRMLYRTPWSAMLDSVKASILGLGGVDCASFYPECNLEKERIKRRHRKRK